MIYYGEFDNIKGENFSVTIGTDGDKSLDYDIFHFNQLILDVVPSGDEIIEPLRYVFVSPKKRVVSTSARTSTSGTVISTKNESFQNWYIEDAPRWVSGVRETSDGFSFDFKYNILDVKRYGVVTLRQEESNKIIMVDIEQAQGDGNYEFSVDSTIINAPSSGETYTIGVTATIGGEDVPFEITYTSDFIHAEIVDGNIIVTVFENGEEERVGTIVIYQDDLDMEIIITVNQEGSQPIVLTRWVATTDVYCFEESEYIERWVESGGYICISQYKYKVLVLEVSYDGGETWSTTEETKIGDLIESESVDCGYVPPIPIPTDCDTIYYTSTDGNIVNPSDDHTYPPPLVPTSNEYIDGLGIMKFDDCLDTIYDSAFLDIGYDGCKRLTSIALPRGITSIGGSAFSGCYNLKNISLPRKLESIGVIAFGDCESLTSIDIPYFVTSIGGHAFEGCSSLTSVTMHYGVTSIGREAFCRCYNLRSIDIPSSVTRLGEYAFADCHFTKDNFYVPSTLKSSYNWGATLHDEETSDGLLINGNVLCVCRRDAVRVTIPSKIKEIKFHYDDPSPFKPIGAFMYCTSLISVNSDVIGECIIPNSVTYIGKSTFERCTSLTSVTIPNSVTSINAYTFIGCSSLTNVTIPNSVTDIKFQAFGYCTSLENIYYNGTISQWNAIIKDRDWRLGSSPYCIVHCTDGDTPI